MSSGQASCTTSPTPAPATYSVNAAYSGDTTYAGSTASTSFTVTKATQAVTFISTLPSGAVYGDSYQTAAAGGPSGQPVTFKADPASGPGVCAVSGATVSFTGAGTCVIDADQAGNADYEAASEVTQTIQVAKATVHVDANPAQAVYGAGDPSVSGAPRTGDLVGLDTATTSGITGQPRCQVASHAPDAGAYL